MIALAADCILLRRENGESEPVSSQAISIEVITEGESLFDEEFVKEASAAVLHYFKKEEGRESVTLGEFAEALEKVLTGFNLPATEPEAAPADWIAEANLKQFATAADAAFELTFFPRVRDELRLLLQRSPQVMRFHGLRDCVLTLTGARRWTPRCQHLQEQIVTFLRECLAAESRTGCALLVD